VPMNKSRTVLSGLICTSGLALFVIACQLFRGDFDHGRFEVKETTRSSLGRIAMIARRSDDEAMNGDQYFVLLGDHVFSPNELRSAYYGRRVLFRSKDDCISIGWSGSNNLTVTCREGSISPNDIAVQSRNDGDVGVSYVNIPEKHSPER
jgi:hypothetical protein